MPWTRLLAFAFVTANAQRWRGGPETEAWFTRIRQQPRLAGPPVRMSSDDRELRARSLDASGLAVVEVDPERLEHRRSIAPVRLT